MRTHSKRRQSGRRHRHGSGHAAKRIQNWGHQQEVHSDSEHRVHARAPNGESLNEHFVNTSPEVSTEYFPALFSFYPELIERVPWVSLRGSEIPSVPRRLSRSRHLFGNNNVFLKLESEDFHIIPENKARKLEFVIGDSLRKKKKKLVTFGYVGSPHCYSTVKAASELGLKSEVVLQKAPLTKAGVEMVTAMRNLGATVRLRSSRTGLMITAGWNWLCSRIFRTELIAPGGVNGLGCLGYVSAMLELKSQIDDGHLPKPDYLFVAAGSGATLVGLEIGKRLADLESVKIVGIQTSDDKGIQLERLEAMGNNAIQVLNQAFSRKIAFSIRQDDFTLIQDYLFGGHGLCPDYVARWAAEFEELEGSELDPVYTAKALYGLSDYIRKNSISDKNFLFWNTYSPFRLGDLPQPWNLKKAGYRLRSWIVEEQKAGRLLELGKI